MPETMQESHEPTALIRKLDQMAAQLRELEDQLNDPAVFGNAQKLVTLEQGAWADRAGRRAVRGVPEGPPAGGGTAGAVSRRRDAEMAELAAAELPDAEAKARRC